MTKISTPVIGQQNNEKDMTSPRKSTVNFIRQFAHAYTVIAGVGLNSLIIN